MVIKVSTREDLTPTQVRLTTLMPDLVHISHRRQHRDPNSFSPEQLPASPSQHKPHMRRQQLLISARHRAKQKLALTKAFIPLQVNHSQLRVIKSLILHPTVSQIWTSLTNRLPGPTEITRTVKALVSQTTQFPLHPGKRATRITSLITQQDLISLTSLSQQCHTMPRNPSTVIRIIQLVWISWMITSHSPRFHTRLNLHIDQEKRNQAISKKIIELPTTSKDTRTS